MQINGATQSAASSMAIFAHELREPLASILLAAQAAGEPPSDGSTHHELWGIVERQSRYLARVIERVMEPGRGSHGKTTLSKQWCDLGATVITAVEAVKSLLTNRGHEMTVSLPPDPVFMLADELRMQQVIINLLANAAKYTGRGGQINVGLEIIDERIVIKVRDNGVGISPDLLPRVFDLFQQGEKPCGSKSPGLGIGLALVKSLVELHGGNVHALSGGPGAGSTFVILLPQTGSGVCKRRTEVVETHGTPGAESGWAGNVMMDA